MRDQTCHVDAPVRYKIEKSFQVPPLRPAHIGEGIVVASFLVIRIIAAGPVCHRNIQRQFFVIVDLARNIHTDETDRYDPPLQTRYLARHLHRLIRRSRGSYEYCISAPSPGPFQDSSVRIFVGPAAIVGSELSCQLDSLLVQIDAEHAAAVGLEQLNRELAD